MSRFRDTAQRLTHHFADGATVTLRSKVQSRLSDDPLEVSATFKSLSIDQREGLEAGAQPVSFAAADLLNADFRLDGSCTVQLASGGPQYPFTPSGGLGTEPSGTEIGDSRDFVRGFIQMGA